MTSHYDVEMCVSTGALKSRKSLRFRTRFSDVSHDLTALVLTLLMICFDSLFIWETNQSNKYENINQ